MWGLDAASGAPGWAKRLESLANLSAPMLLDSVVVRVDSQERALVGGKFSAALAIDGTSVLTAGQLDRTDGFALQLGSTGAVSWSKKYGTYDQDDSGQDAFDTFSDLAITSTDDVWTSGTINPFCPCPGGESTDYWHQLLSGTNGQQLALFQSAPSPAGPNVHDVAATAVNAGGHLVSVGQRPFQLCGGSWGAQHHLSTIGMPCAAPTALTFISTDVEIDDLDETYVLGAGPTLEKRDAGGNLLWSIAPPHGGRLALGPAGDLYLFGDSGGVLMLTRFDDAGGVAETLTFGTTGAVAHDIDIDETDAVYLVGRTTGDLDFGLGPMSGSANDVFVAKVAP